MPKPVPIVKVEPIRGEIGRFHVDSSNPNHEPYLVDLLENGGLGICGCINFEMKIEKNRKSKTGPRVCKHLDPNTTKLRFSPCSPWAYFGFLQAREIAKKARRQ